MIDVDCKIAAKPAYDIKGANEDNYTTDFLTTKTIEFIQLRQLSFLPKTMAIFVVSTLENKRLNKHARQDSNLRPTD